MRHPRQLVVIGDSGVVGWGDTEGGGWCERLRRSWMALPDAPVIYPLGVRGDGLESVSQRWEAEWACRGELRRQYPKALLVAVVWLTLLLKTYHNLLLNYRHGPLLCPFRFQFQS